MSFVSKETMKKIILLLTLSLLTLDCFSKENNYVYNAKGDAILAGDNQFLSLTENNGYKVYYKKNNDSKNLVVNHNLPKPTKQKGKKRWYEVDWNEGVKLCPEKNFNSGDGVWIVNGSAHIDSLNCVYVDGSPYTRSILVLYSRDLNDLTEADSSWILVNQTIVELSKESHFIWQFVKTKELHCDTCYKTILINQDFIVDKTEFRNIDAQWLNTKYCYKNFCKIEYSFIFLPNNDTSRILNYPLYSYSGAVATRYAKWRSMEDKLENVFIDIPYDSVLSDKPLIYEEKKLGLKTILDTSSNGYRIPFEDEWQAFQRAGKKTTFFWGEDDNINGVGTPYTWNLSDIKRPHIQSVAQLKPNPYNLYDVYGNAEEKILVIDNNQKAYISGACHNYSIDYDIGKSCEFQKKIRSSYASNQKKICIDSDCHQHIYREGFPGFRLIRKLE